MSINYQQHYECPKCASEQIFAERDFYYCYECQCSNSYELRYGTTVEEDMKKWLS